MSVIFCSQCGSKHSVGSKFCSSCGNALAVLNQPRRQVQNPQVEIVNDESHFNKPSRLSYEIQNGGNSVFKGEELFKASPVSEEDRINRDPASVKNMTKEEYLSESLKECAPRGMRDIDET